jgi:hypothetical protein
MRRENRHESRIRVRALLLLATAASLSPGLAMAGDAAPANTLAELSRQASECMATHPLGPVGPRITIAFAMRKDGSILGKPRISYARLEGDADARARFTAAVSQALDACLPLKVTPALGGAIAGRIFTITLGRPAPPI